MRIPTGVLNSVLADAQARVQPPTDKGRRLKIYYMTQIGVKPPHFVIFCNDARLFHFSYQRYLENQIRNTFGLDGHPSAHHDPAEGGQCRFLRPRDGRCLRFPTDVRLFRGRTRAAGIACFPSAQSAEAAASWFAALKYGLCFGGK